MTTPTRPTSEPQAGRDAALPARLTRYGAAVHAVEVHWRLRTTRELAVGPAPRLVLAARARKDAELLSVRVDYPRMGDAEMAGLSCEAVLVQVPHACGLRRLKPEGEPLVWGQEGVDAAGMLDPAHPEDLVRRAEAVRWHGGLCAVLEHNVNRAPCVWWVWRGRVLIPRGLSVGVVVRADAPTACRATMAGV